MAATAAVYNRLHNASVGGSGISHHSQLARSLERILEEAHLSGELILTNRKLKDFPKTGKKYNLADTVIADLSRNRFCELPEEITSFSFLEKLLLYHNTIRSIPESVKHLTSLTYLDLRSNQLSSLPREICFLPLQVLLISNNRLSSLPDELGRMDRLTDLDASYNQLTTLPARIGELRSLRSFSLRSNHLMYLPRELTCLTLISLDVSNNRIASLPLEIRQMSSLVEFNLENNPLTSPPANLCVRGLVHVFKFLETQATKDEKGSRAGGNYDGYTTLRRAPRQNTNGCLMDSNRVPRHQVDSGYSTCDGIDKRWSHDMPSVKSKIESPIHRTQTTPTSLLSNESIIASLTSSSSTIVDESISVAAVDKPLNGELSPMKRKEELPSKLNQQLNYNLSNSSSGSSPDQEEMLIDHQSNNQNGKIDEKLNKNLGNIQTYREYKEALKQQRSHEISSVYKNKTPKTINDKKETTNALNSNNATPNEVIEVRFNENSQNLVLPKSIMKTGKNSHNNVNGTANSIQSINGGDDCVVLPKKPIQKVIPSRNTELMSSQAAKNQMNEVDRTMQHTNGECLGYVKPNSPMKMVNLNGNAASIVGGILANNNKITTVGGLKSPGSGGINKLGTVKTNRTVTWNHDIPAEKLSFTMRREFDRQREETELMSQLRSIIETRLKMTLPEDIASALTDGVILCHLANYVHPRSVASIHVPSPGVSKLSMARCRRNVDNFLEACRKIGVDEELICSCADVVPITADDEITDNNFYNGNNNYNYTDNNLQHQQQFNENLRIVPNASAVLKTVAALIAMDSNPHHQNIRNLQQQQEFQTKLQKLQQKQQQLQPHPQPQKQQQQSHYQFFEQHQRPANEQTEQDQLTATRTKQQMQHEHEIVANMEFENSTFNINKKCHLDNVLTNGVDKNYQNIDIHNDDDDVGDGGDDNNDVVDGCVGCADNNQRTSNNISDFFRHAKLKTFQKIKLNLITSHGNNGNNNQCSGLETTLQTIVETENDVLGGGGGGSGAYQLINEKLSNEEQSAKTKNLITADNKYKLLELPVMDKECDNSDTSALVSKRIEFFEHSSTNTNAITPNIGIIGKPKTKNSIFSIYSVASNITDGNLLAKDCVKGKGAGSSSILKHDSSTLTIILSCIFIVTFLLLIFFPLPG